MKTTPLPGILLLLVLAAQAGPVFAAAGGGVPTRSPDAPDAPPFTWMTPKPDEAAKLNAALQALIVKSDPATKAIFDQYPDFQPLTGSAVNPPANQDGNFVIGPVHTAAPESVVQPGVPQGTVATFRMSSTDSKIYPGIKKDALGTFDSNNIYSMLVNSYAAPYMRTVTVYIPSQYVPGTAAPLIVTMDGMERTLPAVLDNMIAQHRLPVMIAVGIGTDGSDAQGSERGLEYDTMSGKYAEFVETEVLPRIEQQYNVKFTKDPEGRAALGGSSGGSCALEMAWYHPDLYHRVLAYSGTFVNQQWPFNPETPHGAWGFHETIIPQSDPKPLRIWMEVGDRDNYNPNVMRDDMHDWVAANNAMAKVLKAKGYHYQYVFAIGAGHNDGAVHAQTLPEALEWLWQGYPK